MEKHLDPQKASTGVDEHLGNFAMGRATLAEYSREFSSTSICYVKSHTANIPNFKVMGEVAVTNKIRQILASLFDKDGNDRFEVYMFRLASTPEFGLHAAEKVLIKKLVEKNDYWTAADTLVGNLVTRKAKEATFGLLLGALKDIGWGSMEGWLRLCCHWMIMMQVYICVQQPLWSTIGRR